jgi:hypothetical protein
MNPAKPKIQVSLKREYTPETKSTAQLLLERFDGNPYYAMSKTIKGEVTYQPVQKPMTEEIVQDHLDGKITLGVYQLSQQSTVKWLGWDIDSTDRTTAKRYAEKLIQRLGALPHVVEFSGSKGYHVLLFLSEPMPANKAKAIVDYVRESEGFPKTGPSHVECYPKQDKLSRSLPMGSLLKLPLGLHPRTHDSSRFVDVANGWEAGDPLPPNDLLQRLVSPDELTILMRQAVDVRQQMRELLVPQWVAAAGEHHNLALHLSGYLAHLGWGMEDTIDLIHQVASEAGDHELDNRVQAVKDTFKNIQEGRNVKGFTGLNELLPGATLGVLSELASKVVTPALVKRIDTIRLSKGASFEKTRATAKLIWSALVEGGEVVQTVMHEAFWFDAERHLLIPFASVRWQAILHHQYGINPADAFGSQVTEELRLKAVTEARMVTVHSKTLWTGEKLLINLGSNKVYELDGEDITTSYNGTCGYLFQTLNSNSTVEPDFSARIDIWDALVKDLSFNKSEHAPATPEEQAELLKAWIMAFFFQELMPTKPLLLAMGVPGSGKTTAMRRILKVLESIESDVLEVVTDKPDSLRASFAKHRLLVLDNLEKSGARWLVDTLNRLATGADIEIRQLYKTNEVYTIKPNCFVAMTAVSMPFSEETLFSRILPLEMQALLTPLPEYLLQKQLQEGMNGMWADLLLKLNQVVATLKRDNTTIPPIVSRLADFTVFCKRIEKSGVVNGTTLIKGLRNLVDRQRMALLEASPFVTLLEEWTNTQAAEAGKWHTFPEIFQVLEPMARQRKLPWRWNNPIALSRHVLTMIEPLKKLYGAEIKEEASGRGGKEEFLIRFVSVL